MTKAKKKSWIFGAAAITALSLPLGAKASDLWKTETRSSKDGGVQMVIQKMSPAQQEQARLEYRKTNLTEVSPEAKYNVRLFRIRGVDEWENKTFIAPKLFAFSNAEKGRLAPEHHSDGTVSLSFPVILTDGTTHFIQTSDGSRIPVPESVAVRNIDELKRRLGTELVPLGGCPKSVIIKVNEREYNVTPRDLARGDYCEINKPFTASIRVGQKEARYFIEEALPAGLVELRVVYEVRAALSIANLNIKFQKSKIFRELEALLKVKAPPYADAEAQTYLRNAVRRQAMEVSIEGDVSPHLEKIIQQAYTEFFTPFDPEKKLNSSACGDAVVCLRLNYNYSKQEDIFQVKWEQSSNTLLGHNFNLWTQLRSLSGVGINIGSENRQPLMNDGKPIETGLTVNSGDILEVHPDFLLIEQKTFPSDKMRRNRDVCVKREQVWYAGCGPIQPVSMTARMDCQSYTRNECVQTENQWIDTTTYEVQSLPAKRLNQPVGQVEQIYQQLKLKFTSRDAQGREASVTCPLNSFQRQGYGDRIVVRLENREDCQIFQKGAKVRPMLHVASDIQFEQTYKLGKLVTQWNGKTIEEPVTKTFLPTVGFGGKIFIRGKFVGSAGSDSMLR